MRLIEQPGADPTVCDRCGQPVPIGNNVVELLVEVGFLSRLDAIFVLPRHLLPTANCPGSPSRAQYLEGQPRDTRGYPYAEQLEPVIRAAYTRLQARAPLPEADGPRPS